MTELTELTLMTLCAALTALCAALTALWASESSLGSGEQSGLRRAVWAQMRVSLGSDEGQSCPEGGLKGGYSGPEGGLKGSILGYIHHLGTPSLYPSCRTQ